MKGLFQKLTRRKIDWTEIKQTNQAYPQHSISLYLMNISEGKATGWIDKGYKDYNFKKFCPYNCFISINLTDKVAESNPELDLATIDDFVRTELRKFGIAHMVARIPTDKGLNIETYFENLAPTMNRLKEISNDPNRLFSFDYEINEDPKWKAVRQLMKW